VKNAFCAVRPPGHHAGVFGSTMYTIGFDFNCLYRHTDNEDMCNHEMTNGFCFINNVTVAAAYLKNVYRH
jgi:acetoin utilization deacetylase AcuC-like enzyme